MNTEILGVVLQIFLLVAISYPLGKYIAKVYKGEKTWSDFMKPVERLIFKVAGINPNEEMNWKQFLKALLILNAFWFVWGMVLLVSQGWLPLNPDGNGPQTPDQAFNTCISFMVNCNLQHYSGESGLTYFTQLFVIMLFQFITAATGMAAMAGIMKSISRKTTNTIGNFWNFLVLSCTRVLLPLSLIVGFILITQGTPMGFDGKMEVTTLEGQEQMVSQGPVAAIVPIKQLGTNGGGYFGVNSSHPLENPTYLSNIVECWSILIIPMAMVFALGFYTKRMKLAYSIYGVMLCAYLTGVGINVYQEMNGNPRIDDMGIAQDNGSMEGKEVRLGSRRHRIMEHYDYGYFQWFRQWHARFYDAPVRYDGDAEHADKHLVRRCRRRVDELLYIYHYRSLYQRTDGGTYTGVSRKESGSPRDENSDNRCAASSVCDIGRHGSVLLPPCAPSGVCRE